jgi:hypothetical protein
MLATIDFLMDAIFMTVVRPVASRIAARYYAWETRASEGLKLLSLQPR